MHSVSGAGINALSHVGHYESVAFTIMAEWADASDLKSDDHLVVRVRVPLVVRNLNYTIMNGYRKLISCRIPKTWDMTLRWCRCRSKFIERVYDVHIRPFNDNVMCTRKENEKKKEERILSYINPKKKFADAIDLTNMVQYRHKDEGFWRRINSWNEWFCTHTLYIKSAAETALICGADNEGMINAIMDSYTGKNRTLTIFILKELDLWIQD